MGRETPAPDFQYLVSHALTRQAGLQQHGPQLEAVLLPLLDHQYGTATHAKLLEGLTVLRQECAATIRPEVYNRFGRFSWFCYFDSGFHCCV